MPLDKRPFIVGLGGTTRQGSSSEQAARLALRYAESFGAEVVMLSGPELVMPMYAPESPARAPEAQRLVELLRRADGVIIASPGYHGSISGLLKNALDYTEDMRSDPLVYFEGRSVGCIACAAGWQATGTTLAALRSIVHALRGWPTPMGVQINTAGKVFAPDGSALEDGTDRQVRLMAEQVVEFARMRATSKHIEALSVAAE